ncbi:hypothetical protein DMC30DRAFT_446172 [Rhodotorula diobovata]|uniref:Uncharacterized protein n=1 Tax=Rhodotorula diobovata TaxID=5288 RepID=A0A5C5FXG5_9BASI|nr:hypothetical protein DMC30DRAFT_446172 [Rhodotorula diobovata]
MASPQHAERLSYAHAEAALSNAATAFLDAHLRADPRAGPLAQRTCDAWERAVRREVRGEWWDLWDGTDQRGFVDDMGGVERWFDGCDPLYGPAVPDELPPLGDPSIPCWHTLKHMRTSYSRERLVVRRFAASPPPHTDGRTWLEHTQRWFGEGVVPYIDGREFDAADPRARREVVDEFVQVYDDLRAGGMALPDISDSGPFDALVLLLEKVRPALASPRTRPFDALTSASASRRAQNAVHRAQTSLVRLHGEGRPPLDDLSYKVSRRVVKLPWWRGRVDQARLQALVEAELKALLKALPRADRAEECVRPSLPFVLPRESRLPRAHVSASRRTRSSGCWTASGADAEADVCTGAEAGAAAGGGGEEGPGRGSAESEQMRLWL